MALSYPSHLSDEQWELLVTLFPDAKLVGLSRSVDVQAIINPIFYIVVAGVQRICLATETVGG